MTDEALAEIKALEERLQDEPDSQEAREGLLRAYVGAHLVNDARRIRGHENLRPLAHV
jgi:hypothetical protein